MKKTLILISALCLLFNNNAITFAMAQPVYNAVSSGINHTIENTVKNTTAKTTKAKESAWPENQPHVNSEAALVMEASTGAILYSKNPHETYYPASITKILTTLLAIENSSLNETVTFSKKAVYDVDLDSSRIGIDVGEKLTMEQSLYGVMLESANEVSYAVAEHVSGTVDAFSDLMNKRAKELGCMDSNFTNPHGLPDENHYTSVYDMALIAKAAINNETFKKITNTRTYVIPPTNIQEETRYLANHHKFIKGDMSFDGAIGGKTGYTSKAKYTLVTFAEREGMTLISVIMYCDTIANEYADTKALLSYGFDNFDIYNIADSENPGNASSNSLFTKYVPLFDLKTSSIQLSNSGNIILPNGATYEDAKKEVEFTPIKGVEAGDNVIGNIQYTYDGNLVGSTNIIYKEDTTVSKLENSFIPVTTYVDDTPNTSNDENSIKPIIIGIIIGVIAISFTLYIVFVELPYRRRRNAYWEKKRRKGTYAKRDYLDF
jgi:D-alanyl-D-alanine carboxypeptidase